MGARETKTGLDLMIEYLDVCNVASEVHRNSLAYKPIIAAYDSFFANRQVGIDIYGKDAAEIETTVTIHFGKRKVRVGLRNRGSCVLSP